MCTTHLCSCISWCHSGSADVAFHTFGRNTGTEHQIQSPVSMMMLAIKLPLAHWLLYRCPSPRLLYCCPSPRLLPYLLSTTTTSPAFRSDGNSIKIYLLLTLTMECTFLEDTLVKSWELFPTHFIKTASAGFVAVLHFT